MYEKIRSTFMGNRTFYCCTTSCRRIGSELSSGTSFNKLNLYRQLFNVPSVSKLILFAFIPSKYKSCKLACYAIFIMHVYIVVCICAMCLSYSLYLFIFYSNEIHLCTYNSFKMYSVFLEWMFALKNFVKKGHFKRKIIFIIKFIPRTHCIKLKYVFVHHV